MAKNKGKANLAKATNATPGQEANGSKGSKKDEKTPESQETLPATTETPIPDFESMCGDNFDPNQAAACYKMCKDENPESFTACLEFFEKSPTKKPGTSAGSKAKRGKNVYGHLNGCQGSLIDDVFINIGGAHTLEKIMTHAEATRPRVISHLKHLVSVWKVDLRFTSDKEYFIRGGKDTKGLVGKKTDGVRITEVVQEKDAA